MGTWSIPTTLAKARELAELVKKPIPASKASDALYHLTGDDGLFDMIGCVNEIDGQRDVRPLLGLQLEEWMDWARSCFRQPWEEGAEEIVEDVLEKCAEVARNDDIVRRISKFDTDDHARAALAAVLGMSDEERAGLEVRDGRLPGIREVADRSGEIYRFESVWGVVNRRVEPEAAAPAP